MSFNNNEGNATQRTLSASKFAIRPPAALLDSQRAELFRTPPPVPQGYSDAATAK